MRVSGVSGVVLALVLTTMTTAAVMAAPDRADLVPAGPAVRHERTAPAPLFSRSALTSDESRYRYTRRADGAVVVRAPKLNPDSNRREVFTEPGAPVSRNQVTCATWVEQSDPLVQEGLAVRVVDRDGRIRAVTLTKNTVFRVDWVFNVVTWDTARDGDPWRDVEQFDMGSVLATPELTVEPFPWRVCLRATGRTISFKVWLPERMAEPSWQDLLYTRSTTIPAAFNVVGAPGWYVGHVPAGGKVVYADLVVR